MPKTNRVVKFAAALIGALHSVVAAQMIADPATYKDLLATRSLKCSFPWSASADWDGDEPEVKRSTKPQAFGFQIDAIDHQKGTARIIGNAGADDLAALRGESSVSFVEQVPSGSVNLTTVYAWRDKAGRFKAVHSRHVAIGGPSPSQNYGFCQPW